MVYSMGIFLWFTSDISIVNGLKTSYNQFITGGHHLLWEEFHPPNIEALEIMVFRREFPHSWDHEMGVLHISGMGIIWNNTYTMVNTDQSIPL